MNRTLRRRIRILEIRAEKLKDHEPPEYIWVENVTGADEDFEAPAGSVVVEDYYQHGGSYSTKKRIATGANDLGQIFDADTGLVIGQDNQAARRTGQRVFGVFRRKS